MNWDDLKIINVLADTGSLIGAAKRLNVNHSTIYRRLGQLEEGLGVRLFERRREGVQPTQSGEEIIILAQRMKEEIDDVTRKLSGRDMRLEGVLRLTTTDTLLDRLTPLLARFSKAYPDVKLELINSNEFVNLSKRDCDIALRASNKPPETLVGLRLGKITGAAYATKTYLAEKPKNLALEEHDWIGFDTELAHLAAARWLEKTADPDKIILRANTLLGVKSALIHEIGAAVLPCFLAEDIAGIERLTPIIVELETDLWLLTHADIRNTARVRAFMDFIAQERHTLNAIFNP